MKVLLVWIATCFIWSTFWVFIKLGLRDLPPMSFAGIRLLIAVTVLLPLVFVRRMPLPSSAREWWMVTATGLLLLGVNYGLVFWGAQHVPSGLTAVLHATTPGFGLVFGAYYLPSERITLLKLCALFVGIAGVAIIFSDQLRVAGWPSLLGSLAVAGGALFVAYSYVLVKAYIGHLNPIVLVTGQMISGMIPLLILGLVMEGNPLYFKWTSAALLSLLYISLAGSIAAFALNYWLLKRMDALKFMLMSIVEPPIAMLLGVLVLGERLTARALWGSSFVLLGTVLIWSRGRARGVKAE